MLEGLVYSLVGGYLSHYVKNFQKEQLRVGLWRGTYLRSIRQSVSGLGTYHFPPMSYACCEWCALLTFFW